MVKKTRNSNIELLRLFSMFLITLYHLSYHGFQIREHISAYQQSISFTNIILGELLTFGGELGVTIFILITGYYLVESNFSMKRILNLIFEVTFYSIIVYVGLVLTGKQSFSITDISKSIFPLLYNQYWFASKYVTILIAAPFINKIFKSFNKKEVHIILLLLITTAFIVPTFIKGNIDNSTTVYFVTVYLVGGYLKIYGFPLRKYILALTVGSLIVLFGSVIAFNLIGKYFEIQFLIVHATYFFSKHSPFVLTAAIGIFLLVTSFKPTYSRFVNVVAKGTLAVYLIHDNNYFRNILWHKLLHVDRFLSTTPSRLVFFSILYSLSVFICFLSVDFIKRFLMDTCKKVLL